MQWSDGFFAGQAPIRFIGECETAVIVQLSHNGIDLRIDSPDPIEMSRHHLAGGEFSFVYETRQFARAGETEAGSLFICVVRLHSAQCLRNSMDMRGYRRCDPSCKKLASTDSRSHCSRSAELAILILPVP